MEGKRYKRSIARADGYNIVCPYKSCGSQFSLNEVSKGDVVTCPNCQKGIRITKVR
jgi:hypothetical protein